MAAKPNTKEAVTVFKNESHADTVSLAYRYALKLTDAQEAAIVRQEAQLRRVWNYMINSTRRTLRDCDWGRKTSVLAEFNEIVQGKRLVGVAVQNARKLVSENPALTVEQAVAKSRAAKVAKMNKYKSRSIGVMLTEERVMHGADHFFGGHKALLYGLIQKFDKCCQSWLKGVAREPRYKRPQDSVALQKQITSTSKCQVGPFSDLSGLIGQAGTRVRTFWHRPLPVDAAIKQLAISGRPGRRYLVISFSCPRLSVIKPFSPSTLQVGIDTGLGCALTAVSTTADQNAPQEYQPPLAQDKKFLKRLRRVQRKMDRQKRSANPDCFNSDGTWKKGKRAKNVTKSMLKSLISMQSMHERIADTRKDFYHVTGYRLLEKYGLVALGAWRPQPESVSKQPLPAGGAKARRNRNRKGYGHAISFFELIMRDKVSRSATARSLEIVQEPWTTQTCARCKRITGPKSPTGIISWTCGHCGLVNHRKANNAQNIKQISADPGTMKVEVIVK